MSEEVINVLASGHPLPMLGELNIGQLSTGPAIQHRLDSRAGLKAPGAN